MVSGVGPIQDCLKALSDPTRLAIVTRLNDGELSVHEVADQFPMSRPAISKHLKILREAGLVAERSEGRERIYSIEEGPLLTVRSWLRRFGASTDTSPSPSSSARQPYHSSRGSAAVASTSGDWRVW